MRLRRFMVEMNNRNEERIREKKIHKISFLSMFYFILFICTFCCFSSCSNQKTVAPQTEFAFGTVCTVNLFEDGNKKLYSEIFALLNSIEYKFSVNISNSEIAIINQNAGKNKTEVSEEVFELIKFSKEMAELTDNSFNPALGSLIKLWAIGTDKQRVPTEEEIESVLKFCDPKNIVLEKDGEKYFVYLTEEKTQIDLGGIVKGYATDKIVEILREKNVKRAVIDLGGNIYVFGKKSETAGEENWRVGIKHPGDSTADPVKIVEVNSTSIVTSGNYERFFIEDGVRYHHILDSKTGRPAEPGFDAVTVIYEKSTVCDVLTTAVFAGGKDLVSKLEQMEKLNGIRVIYVFSDGTVLE